MPNRQWADLYRTLSALAQEGVFMDWAAAT